MLKFVTYHLRCHIKIEKKTKEGQPTRFLIHNLIIGTSWCIDAGKEERQGLLVVRNPRAAMVHGFSMGKPSPRPSNAIDGPRWILRTGNNSMTRTLIEVSFYSVFYLSKKVC